MELRRLSICLAFVLLAFISSCSEARHAMSKRASDYDDNSEGMLNDDSDDGAQNDADGGDEDEEPVVHGVINSKPENYRLQIGKTVRLECRVSPKDGTVVSWSKDGEKLFISKMKVKNDERFVLSEDSSDLLIKDLEINDTGRYTCLIEQTNPVSVTHVIIVEEAPRITNPETTTEFGDDNEIDDSNPRIVKFSATDDGNLREGSNMLLTCDVTGTPKPSIIWSRQRKYGLGGTEPLSEANGEFSEHTFFMKNISKEDAGTYYCYAVSDAGNATSMLTVTVTGKPRVHVHRPVVNTDVGVEAELQCSVHDETRPHIQWYKDEKRIETAELQYTLKVDESTSTLVITPRADEDFGTFTCEAENAHGRHNKSIDLVQSPVIENLDADGPKLTWTVHSHQPLEDIEVQLKSFGEDGEWKTFKVPLPEQKENAHKYELIYAIDEKSLEAGTYEATVKVKNNKSWSHNTDPEIVKLDGQAQPIQTASVFRGLDGNSANDVRPMATVVLSTALMYLLVRTL